MQRARWGGGDVVYSAGAGLREDGFWEHRAGRKVGGCGHVEEVDGGEVEELDGGWGGKEEADFQGCSSSRHCWSSR